MIKVITGHGGPGGSTIALSSLVNLFNKNGIPATLYAESVWNGIDCSKVSQPIPEVIKDVKPDDTVIYHFLTLPRLKCKKMILSCHETELFRLDRVNYYAKVAHYDAIHFVSQFQKDWQCVEGTVIPNPVRKFKPSDKTGIKVAGVIGSIDRNKRTDLSILRARQDGINSILLFGTITDYEFYKAKVEPLLSLDTHLCGISSNMEEVYARLSHVYHSPKLETFNLIKPECEFAGVTYVGNEGNDTKAEYWTDEEILSAWKNLMA
jgi:hypothetical protein